MSRSQYALKRNRKGLQQADWAISIFIFTVYLILFFITVKPLLTPPSKVDSLLTVVEDNFIENTTVSVDRLPILVREYTDRDYEPILLDIPYDWDEDNMAVSEGYFIFDMGKLIFLANTSQKRNYTVARSWEIHETDSELTLVSDEDHATVPKFKAEFDEGLPSRYTYHDEPRIESFQLLLDGEEFDRYDSYENHQSIAKYMGIGAINMTTYVFAENPRTYTYIDPTDYFSHSLKITMQLYNYTEYYTDFSSFGEINYNIDRCREFHTGLIDLSDQNTGMAVFLDSPSGIELCNNETDLWLVIEDEINRSEEMGLEIHFHTGDHVDIEDYPVRPQAGFKQLIDSTSYNAVSMLAATNYTTLKTRWGLVYEHDFRIIFTSPTYNVTVGPEPPLVNVYAKHIQLFNYDGIDYEEVDAVISVWGAT